MHKHDMDTFAHHLINFLENNSFSQVEAHCPMNAFEFDCDSDTFPYWCKEFFGDYIWEFETIYKHESIYCPCDRFGSVNLVVKWSWIRLEELGYI